MVRALVLMMALITAALLGNALWQHYHCGYGWQETNPFEQARCESRAQIEQEIERYRELARMHPYTEEAR